MLILEDRVIDLFVASRIGSLKHIKYHTDQTKNNKKCIENLVEIKTLQKDDTITCMEWGNADQMEILIGRRNQQVQLYNTLQGFTKSYTANFNEGDIVGLGRCKRKLLAALSSGTVKIWSKKEEVMVDTGGKLDRMRVCPDDNTVFGTGGEENDLKIWRIGEQAPTFMAKNLPHDSLQLRRPVWVSDVAFAAGQSGRLAAVCSRHGYVRLYDTRAQRRPVAMVECQMAATCIAPSFEENKFLVGFGRGQLHQVDLRVNRLDKGYKGCAGAVTAVATAPGVIVATSLDRHLRIWDASSKQLLYKQYLTSKLSCLLVQTASSTPLKNPEMSEVKEEKESEKEKEIAVEDVDDMDQLFDKMETVGDKPKKKRHTEPTPTATPSKKPKPSAEGSTDNVASDEEPHEDAIVKLLKSTEKKKKRLAQKKREKKAKSVFHNA